MVCFTLCDRTQINKARSIQPQQHTFASMSVYDCLWFVVYIVTSVSCLTMYSTIQCFGLCFCMHPAIGFSIRIHSYILAAFIWFLDVERTHLLIRTHFIIKWTTELGHYNYRLTNLWAWRAVLFLVKGYVDPCVLLIDNMYTCRPTGSFMRDSLPWLNKRSSVCPQNFSVRSKNGTL